MKYFTKTIVDMRILCFGALCLFAACNRDADSTLADVEKLVIETSVQGYLTGEGTTRATISGLTTTFEAGDAIGFFAIKSGSVIPQYNNLKLTYSGNGKWKSNISIYSYGSDVIYLAYFPYRADMAGKTSLAAIQSAFPVQTDQRTKENFEASNLLTAQTTLSSGSELKFNFAPVFSLVEIDVPAEVKGYSNANGENYTYRIYGGNDFEGIPNAYLSNVANRIFHMIVKPNTNFRINICTPGYVVVYDKTITPAAGKYKRLVLSDKVNRNLQVGDYAYKNGDNQVAFLPNDITTPFNKTDCLGVVFSVGKNAMQSNEEHGMVVARNNAATQVNGWGNGVSAAANYSPAAPADCSSWYMPGRSVMQYIFSGNWGSNGDSFARNLMTYIGKIDGGNLGLDTGASGQLYWTGDALGSTSAYYVTAKGGIAYQTMRSYVEGRMRARSVFKF